MNATCGLAAGFNECNQQQQQQRQHQKNKNQETEATINLHKQHEKNTTKTSPQQESPEQKIEENIIINNNNQHCHELGKHPLELKGISGQYSEARNDDQNKSTRGNESKSRTSTSKELPPPTTTTIDEDTILKQKPATPHTLITFKGTPKGLASSSFDGQDAILGEHNKKRKNTFGHADDRRERPLIDRNSLESIHSKYSTSSANDVTPHTTTGHSSSLSSSPIELSDDNNNNNNTAGSRRGCCCPRPDVAIVATRYVSPPRIHADWLPSKPAADSQQIKTPTAESSLQMDHLEGGLVCSNAIGSSNNDNKPHNKPAQVPNQFAGLDVNNKEKVGAAKTPSGGGKDVESSQDKAANHHKTRNNSKKRASSASSLSTIASTATQPFRPIKRKGPFPFAGILASVLGSVFFSFSVLCIKLLPDDTSSLAEKNKALFFRGVVITVLCAITIPLQGSKFSIPRDEILVNFLRSFFGFLGVFGSYISLKYISMGDSTALVFSSPIWTSLLSHFILEEPLHWIIVFALPVSLFGIVLIAHPALIINMDHTAGDVERQPLLVLPNSTAVAINPLLADGLASNISHPLLDHTNNNSSLFSNFTHPAMINADLDAATMASEPYDIEHRWPGIVIALCTSLMVSCVYIVLKFRKTTHIQTTTFWLGVWTMLCCAFIMCFTGFGNIPATFYEWILLLANGCCSWMGQGLIQWALMHEDASILSVVRTLDVAITFTLSALFLHEEILWTSVVGATIIGLVVVSIVLNNWIRSVLRNRAATIIQVDEEPPHSLEEVDLKNKDDDCAVHRQVATVCSKDPISITTNAHHHHHRREHEPTRRRGMSAAA